VGDLVSGRVVETHASHAKIEISEGVHARCRLKEAAAEGEKARAAAADVDDLAALLASKWKGGGSSSDRKTLRTGQLRRFRIVSLDPAHRRIEVEVAD
jgi:exosome complex RNA-binding protein Rrp4